MGVKGPKWALHLWALPWAYPSGVRVGSTFPLPRGVSSVDMTRAEGSDGGHLRKWLCGGESDQKSDIPRALVRWKGRSLPPRSVEG